MKEVLNDVVDPSIVLLQVEDFQVSGTIHTGRTVEETATALDVSFKVVGHEQVQEDLDIVVVLYGLNKEIRLVAFTGAEKIVQGTGEHLETATVSFSYQTTGVMERAQVLLMKKGNGKVFHLMRLEQAKYGSPEDVLKWFVVQRNFDVAASRVYVINAAVE